MNFDFDRQIRGKHATRLVGTLEVLIEIAFIFWFIRDVAFNDDKHSKISAWTNGPRKLMVETMIGAFFCFALLMSILLVYSTFSACSLTTSKRICTIWCINRVLSFLAAMGLIVQNGGNFKDLIYVFAMIGFLVMWAFSIYFVSVYLGGLDTEINKQIPPQFRKRKVSSVSVLTDENGGGGDLENGGGDPQRNQQYPQFRAYLHRPSLQSSVISISGDEDPRDNPNVLTVPDCRF